MEESNKGIAPFLVAIVLCDDVIQDAHTKKNSLIGIFDRIFSEKFPAAHPKFKIYMKMANAEKDYDFIVEYVQVKTDKVLAKGYLTIKVPSGFTYADIVLEPPQLLFLNREIMNLGYMQICIILEELNSQPKSLLKKEK